MALGLVASPAFAQVVESPAAAPRAEATRDEDIIVTARRTEERLQDVPISITVFNQEQLSDRNVVSAGDLAKYTPSLSVNSRFGSESTSFAIRGFTQEGQTSPSVAVYFGEVISPRAQGGTTAGNGAGVGSFFDLQNVQVLKGPQGTLFGRNTTGGAVLLVPQRPTDSFEGYGEFSLGNYDMVRAQAVINAPLTETIKVRFGIDRQTRDGYSKNVSGIGLKDFNDIDYTALRLSVVADITPELENYTIVSYGLSDSNGSYPKIVNQDNRERDPFPALRAAQIAATSGNYYDVANGNPKARQRIEQWQVINTTTWSPSATITIKNIASYSEFRQDQTSNIYGENGYQNGTTLPFYAVSIEPAPGLHNVAQKSFTDELQLQGRSADSALTYQVGLYYEKSTPLSGFQAAYSANALACTDIATLQCTDITRRGNISVSASEYRFRNLGAYAQGTYKITDQLSVTAGLRYTADKTEGEGRVLRIIFPTPNTPVYGCSQPTPLVTGGTSAQILADPSRCAFRRTAKSEKPTWLIDVDFKPTEDVLIYGKYARGYRQGGVNVSSYGLETWNPERVDSYEIGLKTSFDGAVRGNFNAAAFYNDFSNQQIAINTVSCQVVPTSPACAGLTTAEYPASAQGIGNGGKSTIKGVEVDGSIRPFEGFSLNFAYAHLDTKLKSITIPPLQRGFALFTPNAIVGGPLSLTPRNKYTITAAYDLPVSEDIGRITLAATFTHQDSTFGNASSIIAPGRSAVDNDGEFLPPQDTLNLNMNWNSIAGLPVDLSVFVTNVTKEKFQIYTTGASFGWDAYLLNEPRMVGARLRYRFGD